jgi:arylsulfatase A
MATLVLLTSPLPAQERPPNVVVFLVDDLGWRDLGCYGSSLYETPHIDRLAEQGMRFTSAYAACHVCSPTRASILTGKYPARLGLTDWIPGRRNFSFQALTNVKGTQHLPFEEETLAETLQAAGYTTAAIGKWHLGKTPSDPGSHGFDQHVPKNWPRGTPNRTFHAPFGLQGLEGPKGEYLTDRLTDEAEEFFEANREKPFFLYLAHFAVHDPIEGPADLAAKYQDKLAQQDPSQGPAFVLEGNPDSPTPPTNRDQIKQTADAGFRVLPNRQVKIKQHQDNAQFAAMVEAVDQSLGRVVAKLKQLDLADNTILIFFSDNGGMSGANFGNPKRVVSKQKLDRAFSTSNLPLRGAKGWLYEGGIRVPLIIRWPGHTKKSLTCDEPVISTDLYPSILEMAGLPSKPAQHLDGISLAPLLKGESSLDREALYWHFPHYSNHGMQSPGGAIRAGNYKLLDYFENGSAQLFDLQRDIGEQNDLSRSHPDKVKKLRAMLHAWRSSVLAVMPTAKK